MRGLERMHVIWGRGDTCEVLIDAKEIDLLRADVIVVGVEISVCLYTQPLDELSHGRGSYGAKERYSANGGGERKNK